MEVLGTRLISWSKRTIEKEIDNAKLKGKVKKYAKLKNRQEAIDRITDLL